MADGDVVRDQVHPPAGLAPLEVERRLQALQPENMQALDALLAVAWSTVDPVRLELCRIRMATLMGDEDGAARREARAVSAGLDKAKVDALDNWPHASELDAADRACLAFAEQFNLSVSSLGAGEVDGLREHLSDAEIMDFSNALYAVDMDLRLRMVAQRVLTREGLDDR